MITGIQSLIYGVDEIESGARFYTDFGLQVADRNDSLVLFRLPEGSTIELRRSDDPSLPPQFLAGQGPREVIWGVDTAAALALLGEDLSRDRPVRYDADGTLHSVDDAGIAIGFRVYNPGPVTYDAPAENTPSDIRRRNTHRQWYTAANPKQLLHVVFGSDRADDAIRFYVDRLGFRVTDVIRGAGMFLQCEGRREHHQILFFKAPRLLFSHVSFAVENIDELAAGANHMRLQNWQTDIGLGRHRISSMLFYYVINPAGGKSEYSADGDYLDTDWKPRLWSEPFGHVSWLANSDAASPLAEPDVEIIDGPVPRTLADTARAPLGDMH